MPIKARLCNHDPHDAAPCQPRFTASVHVFGSRPESEQHRAALIWRSFEYLKMMFHRRGGQRADWIAALLRSWGLFGAKGLLPPAIPSTYESRTSLWGAFPHSSDLARRLKKPNHAPAMSLCVALLRAVAQSLSKQGEEMAGPFKLPLAHSMYCVCPVSPWFSSPLFENG
ncbi:hypothetical protein IAQ61_006927 [Plenodomus lingam]|uniref:uncharacterized protein n=1 Tax=Leptosphaeria maculans TaxID=5022 RepID=UPI00332E94F8|nr:hypothetical protein IAQ61_006927 [Plenodomus lingam]